MLWQGNYFVFEKIACKNNPQVCYISYFDIAKQLFFIHQPCRHSLDEFPDVPYPNEDVVYVIAKCDYKDKTYKVCNEGYVYDASISDIEKYATKNKLRNAFICNRGTDEAYIKLKKGDLKHYAGNGRNRLVNPLPDRPQGCVLFEKKYGEDLDGRKYHYGTLDFFKNASTAVSTFKARADEISAFKIEGSASYTNNISPSAELYGTAFKSTSQEFTSDMANLSVLKMICSDDGSPVNPERDIVWGIYTDALLDNGSQEYGIIFFRDIREAKKYYIKRITELQARLPGSVVSNEPHISLFGIKPVEQYRADGIDLQHIFVGALKIEPSVYKRVEAHA